MTVVPVFHCHLLGRIIAAKVGGLDDGKLTQQNLYYCPLKANCQVDDSGGKRLFRRIDALDWSPTECEQSKTIKLKGFPKDRQLRLFRAEVPIQRTD